MTFFFYGGPLRKNEVQLLRNNSEELSPVEKRNSVLLLLLLLYLIICYIFFVSSQLWSVALISLPNNDKKYILKCHNYSYVDVAFQVCDTPFLELMLQLLW